VLDLDAMLLDSNVVSTVVSIIRETKVRQRSNKLMFPFLIPSFYTCEDAAVKEEDVMVWPWGHLAPTTAAVASVTVVPGSYVMWSHIFVL
jgi:hypothetical protein